MPLFMDVHHNVEGLTKEKLEDAHKKDIAVQEKYGTKFIDYWYSKDKGKIFCLCEAPNLESAQAVHKEAHGDSADEVFEVKKGS